MKKYSIILIACFVLAGCATLKMERVNVPDPAVIDGTYNMIIIGGTFVDDAERVVILDNINDNSTFRPVTLSENIKVVEGLTGAEALQRAEVFFEEHCAYNGYSMKKLNLPEGAFVGYELIPDYPFALCENGNILQVSYGQGNDGEIKVYTWLLLKKETGEFESGLDVDREK